MFPYGKNFFDSFYSVMAWIQTFLPKLLDNF